MCPFSNDGIKERTEKKEKKPYLLTTKWRKKDPDFILGNIMMLIYLVHFLIIILIRSTVTRKVKMIKYNWFEKFSPIEIIFIFI